MRLNRKAAGVVVLATVAVAGSVYLIGVEQAERAGQTVTTPKSKSAERASRPAAAPALPPSHPVLRSPPPQAPGQSVNPLARQKLTGSHPPIATPPPGADAREGRVEVDPGRPYTHFRVGNSSVIAIYVDGAVTWLGTSGGIVRYDTAAGEFRQYDSREGLRARGILFLGKLRGRISAGTYGDGLWLFDRMASKWEHYGVPEGLGDGFVYDALEASGGDVWIATGSGVNRVRGGALNDRNSWEIYTVENTGGGLPNNRVYRLVEAKDGSIWFATRGGVAHFRKGEWGHWTHARGLGAAHRDEVASERGVSRAPLHGALQSPETRASGAKIAFNPDHIAALEVGRDGTVWAGTRGAGLARFDGTAWKNYTMADGLPSQYIATLNFDPSGRLWVGTTNGLAVLKDGKFRVMTTAHGLVGESVLSLATTRDGGIWVGGFGGVAHIRQSSVDGRPVVRMQAASPAK